jgi:DNA-binding PucR family transcriptional regulator
MSVIARQMDTIRDEFVAEVFGVMTDQLIIAYEQEHYRWVSRRGAPLWVDAAVPTRDVVALFDQVRDLVAAELDRVRRAFESAGVPARLAFGRLEDGLTGFRTSLKQAERVKEAAVAGGDQQSARVVFYGEVAPIALMASDLDQLRRFVSDVLSDLGVDDERCRWLRETLRKLLARNRSYVATAEAMILHRNTIQYRVAQAMELCGRSFDDPDTVFKVRTAVEACWWMGSAVLRAGG